MSSSDNPGAAIASLADGSDESKNLDDGAKSASGVDDVKLSIETYWREFQYRHTHCMGMFYKAVVSVCVVSTVPFFYDGKIGVLQKYAFIFPSVGLLISMISAWLIYAEFLRMKISLQSYNAATRRLTLPDGSKSRIEPHTFPAMFGFNVAAMLSIFLLVLGVLLSSVSMIVLAKI